MFIKTIAKEERDQQLVDALVSLWRDSVSATHHFLNESDIARIEDYVPDALRNVDSLAATFSDEGDPLGFAGVADQKLEMLFVRPEFFGQGIGSALLKFAVAVLGAFELEVNEQNPRARQFYENNSWKVTGRRETDDQGEPYPLLTMKLM